MRKHITYTHMAYPAAKLCIAFMMHFLLLDASAQNTATREYQLKAAFIYNFTKFVDWPSASFNTAQAPFIIGILGEDPFGSFIDETVAGERVKGHPIIIRRYKSSGEITHCHLLFISAGDAAGITEQIAGLKPGMLTVSDSPGFNTKGGMIRLMTVNNKIKLIINPSAVNAAELNISSKLLNIAEIFVARRS